MSNLLTSNQGSGEILPYSPGTGEGGIVQAILSAIPSALAAPILAYQRTKAQKELVEVAIQARRAERCEILKTMCFLAKLGQLTPELSQQLMVAYYHPAY